ncbi:DUF2339 domain-containing protein [Budvicia diplopodorum]|uniref:DUF2339 domain-containing protein n=1 Tax=Budvicia diplopodorum TaxID=1119056 RepID=UPI001FE29C64|nr:DUF2339 domain-containing protein [Budvicia diplopodorum]
MDSLILFGILILMVIVASPIMVIIALNRSREASDAVSRLKQQVEALQKQLAAREKEWADIPVAPRQNATASSVSESVDQTVGIDDRPAIAPVEATRPLPDKALPAPKPEPAVVQRQSAAPIDTRVLIAATGPKAVPNPVTPGTTPTSTPRVRPPEAEPVANPLSGVMTWLFKGNPVAKLGILLLFFGIAYLLKYSIDRNMFPIELRLASAALGSVVLLALGWRLRHKQPLYGLILQGGAIGALYITVFAAFKLYFLLPHLFAFALMVIICAASVGLAVMQRALSLAVLASIGGYLAPVMLSTGSADHIGLFSYYLLISVGILAISVWQSWRVLNLIGFAFTFGIAALWGAEHYRPEYYLSCQLFLVANLVLFSLLAELFAVKHRIQQHMAIDATLLFGPALIGFGMQYIITEHWPFGPAFSALGFGIIYLLITLGTLKRFPEHGRRLAIGYLALGASFVTLAIPLALSAQWTALAWSVEGLGILWFGLLQGQRRISWSGTGLLALALVAQLTAYFDNPWDVSTAFVLPVLFCCFIAAGKLWRHYHPEKTPWQALSLGALLIGIAVWLWWLVSAPVILYRMVYPLDPELMSYVINTEFISLLGLSLSVWIWRKAGLRLAWPALRNMVWLLWPGALLVLLVQLTTHSHPLYSGMWNLVWVAAIGSAGLLLKRDSETLRPVQTKGLHLSLFWMILLLLGSEVVWRIGRLAWGMEEWRFYLYIISLSVVILGVWIAERRKWWPVVTHAGTYWLGTLPLALAILGLLVFGNALDGQIINWTYIPLVNPLEEGAIFGLLMLFVYLQRVIPWSGQAEPLLKTWGYWLIWGLAAWWFNGSLMRTLAYYADLPWWFDMLWASRLIQTTFAIVWALVALICMIYSARTGRRNVWFAGAAVLGAVIIKLFLVDSAHGGGLARAIAFLGVAVLLLIVGYFSPLPPREPIDKESKA